MQPEWWQWTVAGIALILSEFAVPAFLLLWFGVGALIVAGVAAVVPELGLSIQMGIWLGVSFLLLLLALFLKRLRRRKRQTSE